LTEDKELYQQNILELTSDENYENTSLQSIEYFVEERKAYVHTTTLSKQNLKRIARC